MSPADLVRPVHGGDAPAIARRLGRTADTLVDFSANINPAGPPEAVRALLADPAALQAMLGSYPDRDATVLADAIAARYGVARASIVVANGGAALVDAVLRALPPGRILVPVPAFSEYARAVAASGHAYERFALDLDAEAALDADRLVETLYRTRPRALILTSPHNPSGGVLERRIVRRLRDAANGCGCLTLLDEAFIDYVPELSFVAEAPNLERCVVLRSVTKFYALPALRVAYAVAPPLLAERIAAFLPSWPVTTLALEAAARALGDPAFDARTLAANTDAREEFAAALRALGARVFPSAANFLLVDLSTAWGPRSALCERLARDEGFVVRDCGDYDGIGDRTIVRVAVRTRAENAALVAALRRLRASVAQRAVVR